MSRWSSSLWHFLFGEGTSFLTTTFPISVSDITKSQEGNQSCVVYFMFSSMNAIRLFWYNFNHRCVVNLQGFFAFCTNWLYLDWRWPTIPMVACLVTKANKLATKLKKNCWRPNFFIYHFCPLDWWINKS